MINAKGYAVLKEGEKLKPFDFERRDTGPKDVVIKILYCGVCHSDIHKAKNEWGNTTYPIVPGHEIIGEVISVGSSVKKFKAGEKVGVGVIADVCGKCAACKAGEEQHCIDSTHTYGSIEKQTGKPMNGGYSDKILIDESCVFRISPKADLAATAPLLCAGITTWSPMTHWGVGSGKKVGVVGLGGLGHMAVKLAHALGAHVVVFTTSKSKVEDAKRLGADEVILQNESKAMKSHAKSLDYIIDTVSAPHDLSPLLALLAPNGGYTIVGLPDSKEAYTIDPRKLIFGNHFLSGSNIGGLKETQEMLDFCAKKGIAADIELIPIQKINEAFDRAIKSDVKYRFVIDMSSLK